LNHYVFDGFWKDGFDVKKSGPSNAI